MSASSPPRSTRSERRLLGVALRMGATFCFALMAALIKAAANAGIGTLDLIFYRNLFSVPLIFIWLAFGPGFSVVKTKRPRAHLTRAFIGLISLVVNIKALTMLPIAEATTIGFAAPLFATILSVVILKEKVGRHRWWAVVIGFFGVLMVMRPGAESLPADGLTVALLAALGIASVVITIRQIGATEHPAATVSWFNMVTLLVLTPPMILFAHPVPAETWITLIALGVVGGLAQILMTSSLSNAPVAVLAPFDYLQLMWVTLIGWLWWSVSPLPTTIAGGLLIAGSGIYTAFREHSTHRRELAAASTPPAV